ncbi:MAG TPA: DUF1552 domain-containing protein [Polyangiaceae bacterium]|nr:DUF1552 domain-containing protein [Polyangiaceae bacterium]
MSSYRTSRRAFMYSVAGAVGFELLLRNLEASAQGAVSPARLLVLHSPLGTVHYDFVPQGTGRNYVTSPILEPFEASGLREDMIALHGFSHAPELVRGVGAHEGGTVAMMTGAPTPGPRFNGGERDDACAGGPSFDQILLKHAASLQRPGVGYANAICDSRVESFETSTRCLSYSHLTREVPAFDGTTLTENVPLLPELEPVALYASLFAGFMPGPTGSNVPAAIRALRLRKSVLDASLRELSRLRTLAPASESARIDAHAEAIRSIELQLTEGIRNSSSQCPGLTSPDPNVHGKTSSQALYNSNPRAEMPEELEHEQVGRLHLGVLRAAFQCDVIRVATFQWAPGQNMVAFQGLYPADPGGAYRHHPLSHRVISPSPTVAPTDPAKLAVTEFLSNVQVWYNQRFAEFLVQLKATSDVYGGNLLDSTILPCVTEIGDATHRRSPIPALIFGGKKLGMQGGQFQQVTRSHTDLWLTLAQAFLPASSDVRTTLRNEVFARAATTYSGPIDGLWQRPT